MTAEEFVKRCQEATRLNFTYDKDTREALAAQEFRFDGPKKLPASEISGFVTAQLAHCGLTCKAIGPEQLHTFLITSAAAR